MGKGLVGILAGIFLGLRAACGGLSFEISDPAEFSRIIDTNAVLTTNANINSWLEGPTWIPSGNFLVFCDESNNRLRKLVPPTSVTDFVLPLANTIFNGTILDAQQRLIGAEAGKGGLRISMITNSVPVALVTMCNTSKFYSPNDVAVKSDGTIWFTDPNYNSGISKGSNGFAAGYYVYQFHPTNGNATCRAVITNGIVRPNGLCFSPDETKLYVADSDTIQHRIQVYSVSASNTVTGGAVFANVNSGIPDGIHCDADGRVWSSAGDGVHIFAASDGHRIGKIKFLRTANLCFGGPQNKTLYMTGQPLVTSIPVLVPGISAWKELQINSKGDQPVLSWPAPSPGWTLQETNELTPSSAWTNSPLPVTVTNNQNTVTVETTNTAKLFRLRLAN